MSNTPAPARMLALATAARPAENPNVAMSGTNKNGPVTLIRNSAVPNARRHLTASDLDWPGDRAAFLIAAEARDQVFTIVDRFGEAENIYIGGEEESFDQCTDACHTTHPGSEESS